MMFTGKIKCAATEQNKPLGSTLTNQNQPNATHLLHNTIIIFESNTSKVSRWNRLNNYIWKSINSCSVAPHKHLTFCVNFKTSNGKDIRIASLSQYCDISLSNYVYLSIVLSIERSISLTPIFPNLLQWPWAKNPCLENNGCKFQTFFKYP